MKWKKFWRKVSSPLHCYFSISSLCPGKYLSSAKTHIFQKNIINIQVTKMRDVSVFQLLPHFLITEKAQQYCDSKTSHQLYSITRCTSHSPLPVLSHCVCLFLTLVYHPSSKGIIMEGGSKKEKVTGK